MRCNFVDGPRRERKGQSLKAAGLFAARARPGGGGFGQLRAGCRLLAEGLQKHRACPIWRGLARSGAPGGACGGVVDGKRAVCHRAAGAHPARRRLLGFSLACNAPPAERIGTLFTIGKFCWFPRPWFRPLHPKSMSRLCPAGCLVGAVFPSARDSHVSFLTPCKSR